MANSQNKSWSAIPILQWLPAYKKKFIKWDFVAGITLAFFVLPESMAYATLAGLPTYFGIYCCLVGGLLFAIFTTSRQVVVGPTSAISLMVGTTIAVLSGGDPSRWAGLAALAALIVAVICMIAFVLKLSSLVNFISDSILLGFKAGAAFSIMTTQLPKLFGVEGGGTDFFSRLSTFLGHLSGINWPVLFFGVVALIVLIAGDKIVPGKPVSLLIVIVSIVTVSLTNIESLGFHLTGTIPQGLPSMGKPAISPDDLNAILPLAFACFLVGYIETISAARTFASKNNYSINPRQELLALGVSNLAAAFSNAYVVSGGLSQSTVNDKSGAKTPMSLVICSITLALLLLFLTGPLANLPEVILAVIVLHAVAGLIKVKELKRIFHLSKVEFGVAMIAFAGVLALGILKGVMLAVVLSLIFLIVRTANPHVAILGRIKNSNRYSDIDRHPDNLVFESVVIFRVESSILYFNSQNIYEKVWAHVQALQKNLKLVILDLSAAPYVDVEGSRMLRQLAVQLNSMQLQLKIVEALSSVREILRKQGVEELIGHISRQSSVHNAVEEFLQAENENV